MGDGDTPPAEAYDVDEHVDVDVDEGGFGRSGLVRQVASVVLVTAIIGGLGAVALTGGAVVPDSPEADAEARVGRSTSSTTTASRGSGEVPQVVGLPLAYAMEVLRKAGFTGVVSVSRTDERAGKGKIANQVPAAGVSLERGGRVELALSLGPEDRPVPDLVGYPVAAALNLLQQAGMQFTAQVEPSDLAKGTVLRTTPAAGEKRPKGTVVLLVIASGPNWDTALAGLEPGADLALGNLDDWVQPQPSGPTAPVTPPGGQTSVTLPPRPSSPPTTRPPTPTTRPPTTRPPTTRPPTTQPSAPVCYEYPEVTYWEPLSATWVHVPASTVCA